MSYRIALFRLADEETSLRLGYLIPEFPGQTHIFFWREVLALRRMGEEVFLLSTRKPSPLICRHDFALRAASETHYVYPPAWLSFVNWAKKGCRGISSAVSYIRGLDAPTFGRRLHLCGLLLSAIDLMDWARRQRIDHIHVQSCADAAHMVALARLLGGPPYSLALHGDLEVYGTDHRAKMERASFICVVGNHLRQQVAERVGLPANRVHVTFMGVETSELSRLGHARRSRPGALHLVTVARLNRAKGHMYALAAINEGVKAGLDLTYTIAGEGPYRSSIALEIERLGLKDRVRMAGTLSEKEVHELLSMADAMLLTSTGVGEAWPVSVMEAMGSGLPVIASIVGATQEMITSGVDGVLVPQKDETAILEGIALLASDVETRRKIGAAGRVTALRCFDVAARASALRDAIRTSIIDAPKFEIDTASSH